MLNKYVGGRLRMRCRRVVAEPGERQGSSGLMDAATSVALYLHVHLALASAAPATLAIPLARDMHPHRPGRRQRCTG
jgi:hypothetical protein